MYHRIDVRERNTNCSLCSKPILGKLREYCFRVSKNGCGVNFCANCLRDIADQLDEDNKKLKRI